MELLGEILKMHQSAEPFLDSEAQILDEKRPIDSGLVCLDDRVQTMGGLRIGR